MIRDIDFQTAAVSSIFSYFTRSSGNPIVAMPTGVGKSVVIARFIKEVFSKYQGQKILVVTHSAKIIKQNYLKLLSIWPTAPAGINSAKLKKRDLISKIIFCGIKSVKKYAKQIGKVDLLLIDECHLISEDKKTEYRVFIDELTQINPLIKGIGFTATYWRSGYGLLFGQEDSYFTDVCFDLTTLSCFNWIVNEGYLTPLIPRATNVELDVSGVSKVAGDFKSDELEDAVNKEAVTRAALLEMIEAGQDRNRWLLFCSGVDHAVNTHKMLNEMGIPTGIVHSKMGETEADTELEKYTLGKYRAMVNYGMLTTGYDDPMIDLIGMLRPSCASNLWVQMLGRGTRVVYANGFDLSTAEGRLAAIASGPKQNCLVLDFARNTERLGPINDPFIPKRKGDKPGEAPIKLCPSCGVYNHASIKVCPYCGHEYIEKVKLVKSSGSLELIKKSIEPVISDYTVDHITYSKHVKYGSEPMLLVSYYCGKHKFSDYVCLQHNNFAKKKAELWWLNRASGPIPATIEEALERYESVKCPTHLKVDTSSKYPIIKEYCYDGSKFGEAESNSNKPLISLGMNYRSLI